MADRVQCDFCGRLTNIDGAHKGWWALEQRMEQPDEADSPDPTTTAPKDIATALLFGGMEETFEHEPDKPWDFCSTTCLMRWAAAQENSYGDDFSTVARHLRRLIAQIESLVAEHGNPPARIALQNAKQALAGVKKDAT